jgi:hypothetical protein
MFSFKFTPKQRLIFGDDERLEGGSRQGVQPGPEVSGPVGALPRNPMVHCGNIVVLPLSNVHMAHLGGKFLVTMLAVTMLHLSTVIVFLRAMLGRIDSILLTI